MNPPLKPLIRPCRNYWGEQMFEILYHGRRWKSGPFRNIPEAMAELALIANYLLITF